MRDVPGDWNWWQLSARDQPMPSFRGQNMSLVMMLDSSLDISLPEIEWMEQHRSHFITQQRGEGESVLLSIFDLKQTDCIKALKGSRDSVTAVRRFIWSIMEIAAMGWTMSWESQTKSYCHLGWTQENNSAVNHVHTVRKLEGVQIIWPLSQSQKALTNEIYSRWSRAEHNQICPDLVGQDAKRRDCRSWAN